MSVTRLPSGRFSARLPRSTGGRSETFDTEAEAHDWLAAMREALTAMRQPNGTLRSWGETVLERRQSAGLASARGDASRWAHILDSDLADMALTAIKPRHVADFARDLAAREARRPAPGGKHKPTGKTISRQTQVHVLNLLRVVLAEAVISGKIDANPALEIGPALADEGEDLDRWTWLTAEEIAQLLASEAIPVPIRLIYTVAIFTGLRQGELWALRWERVRLVGAPQITVAKSGRRKSTKSGKVGAVPLLPQALAALRRVWEAQGKPKEGLVFPGPAGGQRSKDDDAGWADQRRGLREDGTPIVQLGYRGRAGIRPAVRFHDFRHTCASHLLQGSWGRKWRLEEVREMLRHSSIVVTQRYAHLGESAIHEAAAATNGSTNAPALSLVLPPSVGPVGFEPTTNGLKGAYDPLWIRMVAPPTGRSLVSSPPSWPAPSCY